MYRNTYTDLKHTTTMKRTLFHNDFVMNWKVFNIKLADITSYLKNVSFANTACPHQLESFTELTTLALASCNPGHITVKDKINPH